MEPVSGFEPLTRALRMRCSTTELHRPAKYPSAQCQSSPPVSRDLAAVKRAASLRSAAPDHVSPTSLPCPEPDGDEAGHGGIVEGAVGGADGAAGGAAKMRLENQFFLRRGGKDP